MAHLRRAENGTPWFEITWRELVDRSKNGNPVCDDCLKSLVGCERVVLIPILNQAYCPEHGKKVLGRIRRYQEDMAIEERRTRFYMGYFGIPGGGVGP